MCQTANVWVIAAPDRDVSVTRNIAVRAVSSGVSPVHDCKWLSGEAANPMPAMQPERQRDDLVHLFLNHQCAITRPKATDSDRHLIPRSFSPSITTVLSVILAGSPSAPASAPQIQSRGCAALQPFGMSFTEPETKDKLPTLGCSGRGSTESAVVAFTGVLGSSIGSRSTTSDCRSISYQTQVH